MTTVQHHMVTQTHSTSNQLDNHLDALLDDLQTSVSRPGASMALAAQNGPLHNGPPFGGQVSLPPGASGYREITTTVTRDTNGVPMTSREYQIEYLNPANSVTVLDDRSSSPAMDLLKSADMPGHQVKSFKTEVYDYKFSKTTSDRKVAGGYGGPQPSDEVKTHAIESKSYHQSEPQLQDSSQFSRGETNVSKNLNELDMLLKELNNSPGSPDSRREHVQTIDLERREHPERYSETMPKRSASATREMTYSERSQSRSGRAQSPTILSSTPKAPARTINVQREYNTMETRTHTSRRDSPSARSRSTEMSPTLRRRTPSPSSGEFRPSNFSNYPISPKDLTPTRTTTSKSYSYSSTGRRTPTPASFDEPQPYRSPSPVSFPQRRSPSPARKSLNRSDSGRTVSYQVSPPMTENPTVITYKYSSHSREQSRYPGGGYEEQDEQATRPFPTSTPAPAGEQSPPKKLDELMASFQDSKSRPGGEYSQGSSEYRHHVEYAGESRERHGGELQRSPSFERNLRPSNVKVTQSYSSQQQQQQQQQQQNQEYQNQYQYREQHQQSQYQQNQYQQREQQPTGSYQREYQRKEEYQTREQPGQYQQKREEYQTREQSAGYQRQDYQDREQQQREEYQRSQYQQFHQNQGAYQREHREQYQQNQSQYQQNQSQYQQNQGQYQYQQHQQFQHGSSQGPINESMSSSQAYRSASAGKSVAGPPVYYPPGVELFTKKEEAMLMQEQSGKGKSKSKSKSKSDKGKDGKGKGVPVCLPVCCAMPCSIM